MRLQKFALSEVRHCARLLVAITALCVWAGAGVAQSRIAPLSTFEQGRVTVTTRHGAHQFSVWLALTDAQQEQGLMFVPALTADQGMFFVFEEAEARSFWMKNTLIPLDILFVAPDHRIIRIAENATPQSLTPIPSMGPSNSVLELAGGRVHQLGISPGDRVDLDKPRR